MPDNATSKIRLITLFTMFLKIGSLSFGGWSSTVVLLEKELQRRDLQVDTDTAVSYAQILPGATQVAIVSNVGYQFREIRGAIAAACGYLMPTVTLMTLFAAAYYQFLLNSGIFQQLDGLIAALSGIILANAYRIGRRHTPDKRLWLAAFAAFMSLISLQANALLVILVFGSIALLVSLYLNKSSAHAE